MIRHTARSLFVAVLASATLGPPAVACRGDINGDGVCDMSDLAQLLGFYGMETGAFYEHGNLDADGDVDLDDLAALLGAYGTSCPQIGDLVVVPASEFQMGDPWAESNADQLPVHAVYLDTFQIDAFLVTNQQYADALNWALAQGGLVEVTDNRVCQFGAGVDCIFCETTDSSDESRIVWNGVLFSVRPDKGDHPIAMLTRFGAAAFCNWRSMMEGREPCFDAVDWSCDFTRNGYRLPTEAEWEKAAAWDPVLQRHYRYGIHTDGCGYNCLAGRWANFRGSGDPYESDPTPRTTPVGYYNGITHNGYRTLNSESYYGCYDMCGNLSEWVIDRYSETYYSESPYANPAGPSVGDSYVWRGGSWFNARLFCSSAYRGFSLPQERWCYLSFRCVLGSP